MAALPFDSLEHMLLCHVCFEGFEESGDFVPRLLPCSHTLCHGCFTKLIHDRSITCPECRTTHTTPESKDRSFPQNKYILTILRGKRIREENNVKETNNEPEKEISLPEPETRINQNGQKDEKDAEADEGTKQDFLMNRIRAVKNTIWKNDLDFRTAKAEVEKKSTTSVEKLREKQEELVGFITKRIDELKKDVVDHKTEVLTKLDQEIADLEENISALDAIKDQHITNENNNSLEVIRKIEQNIKHNQTDMIYRYLEYNENTVPIFDLNKMCGHLRQQEKQVSQSRECGLTRPRVTILKTFRTELNTISPAVVLPNETIVVAGIEDDQPVLKRFDTRTGEKLNTAILPNLPLSMTRVHVEGICHVALASSEECIEFRQPGNLDNIVNSMVVSKPWRTCSVPHSSSTLLHLDKTKFDFLERWDCSTLPPMMDHNVKVTDIKHDLVLDLQLDQWNNKDLLITTCYSDYGIYVYDISDGCLIWNARGKIPGMKEALKAHGVAPDGNRHLFVCDRGNACIQMFSLADGKYLGALLREGDQGLREPHWVRWCSITSSLIVSHGVDDQRYISVIKLRNRSTSVAYDERFSLCS